MSLSQGLCGRGEEGQWGKASMDCRTGWVDGGPMRLSYSVIDTRSDQGEITQKELKQ